ncbi:MAG: tRNA (guanosine(37)-N1)-methyltransferase TrmD [Solirubrobacterales bacterium]|nr:tRNA (guanosine(37)-N1)-methyltransferase TrmD [Solirubrobacterales bacterium]
MNLDVFTLFPDSFEWFLGQHHVRNALQLGHQVECVDYRDSTTLSGRQVDDAPFGGGAGMVLRVDVIEAALRDRYGIDPANRAPGRRVIALTPGGRVLDEDLVNELAAEESVTLLCGRYEGFDERAIDNFCTDRVSLGRFVLAGGEIPAMAICDAVLRKLPGVLGDEHSAVEESFSEALDGAPEYPHYTRPAVWRDWAVPEVLLSGDHGRIEEWRMAQSQARGAAQNAQEGG